MLTLVKSFPRCPIWSVIRFSLPVTCVSLFLRYFLRYLRLLVLVIFFIYGKYQLTCVHSFLRDCNPYWVNFDGFGFSFLFFIWLSCLFLFWHLVDGFHFTWILLYGLPLLSLAPCLRYKFCNYWLLKVVNYSLSIDV